jgi:hypothetical protein
MTGGLDGSTYQPPVAADNAALVEELTKALPLLDGLETGQDCEEYAFATGRGFQAMTYCPGAFEALRCIPRVIAALSAPTSEAREIEREADPLHFTTPDALSALRHTNSTSAVEDEREVEAVARIIDPSSWRVMDGYLEQTKRKYRGQNVGWPADQYQDKASMAKAREILTALSRPSVAVPEVERLREAAKQAARYLRAKFPMSDEGEQTAPGSIVERIETALNEGNSNVAGCEHDWEYTRTDYHGSHKGEDHYRCRKCGTSALVEQSMLEHSNYTGGQGVYSAQQVREILTVALSRQPTAEADEVGRLRAMLVDDPNDACAGVPEVVIEAGIAVQDRAIGDLRNYIAGVTCDWDEGMLAAAIFKAMLSQALTVHSGASDSAGGVTDA